MSETSVTPPEPVLTRQVVTKPDGRRLIFYTFAPPAETADSVRRVDEASPDVGTALESPAG